MDQYTPPPIELHQSLDATPDGVWRVMTESAPAWLCALRFKPELGRTFFIQTHPFRRALRSRAGAAHADVLELAPHERMAFSWYQPGAPATLVSFDLAAEAELRTRVILTHDGWEQFPAQMAAPVRAGLAEFWGRQVLPALRLETIKRFGG